MWRMQQLTLSEVEKSKIQSVFSEYAPLKHDTWGASEEALLQVAPFVKFLYEKYFRVSVSGIEKIPDGPVLFIANHGGQIPVDGMMIVYSLLVKADKNRLLRGMAERWVPSLPFIGAFFMKLGQIVGDPKNCLQFLQNKQSVLVFPEGVKGSGKTIQHRYQLQKFPIGFYRLALEAGVPIVPVTLIGTEETYPSFANFKSVAKLLKAPYFPITPTFPFLGPLGLIPLPAKISIKFLDPIYSHLNVEDSDNEVLAEVEKIQSQMQQEINKGLESRGDNIFTEDAFKTHEQN